MLVYLAIFLLCLVAVALGIRRHCACKPWHAVHYALLLLFSGHGLLSLLLAYADIGISLHVLAAAMLVMLMATIWFMVRRPELDPVGATVVVTRLDALPYVFAWAVSVCIGVMFFSPDLVPSSMTGDPARHFLEVLKFSSLDVASPAWAYKPIYYLMAGLFLATGLPWDADQLFVLFTIVVLGLSVSSCVVLADSVFDNRGLPERVAAVLLIALGYHSFALHYGYYTLLLSAAFLFSGIAALSEYHKQHQVFLLGIASSLAVGVALTHAFLLPDIVAAFIGILALRLFVAGADRGIELRRFALYLVPVIGVALASNAALMSSTPDGYSLARVIRATGFTDSDPSINLDPFIPAALIYFALFLRQRNVQVLAVFVAATGLFSLAMATLENRGLAAPYYVNRNQLILLPLLSLLAMDLVSRLRGMRPTVSLMLSFGISGLLVLPYWTIDHQPMAMIDDKPNSTFRALRNADDGVFATNSITTSFSPLQMTGRDRQELLAIGKGGSECLPAGTPKLLVLGTDHQVIWLGIYMNLQPSLTSRGMYVGSAGYDKDFRIWLADDRHTHVAVIKHLNYAVAGSSLAKIRSTADLVCEGDSFAIYRKRAQT